MHDDELTRAFRTLDEPADPDPAFGDALFERLRAEASMRPASGVSRFVAPLAAAILVIAAAGLGIAAGTGFVNLPWMVADATSTASPSMEPMASPSSSAEAPSTPEASAQAEPGVPDFAADMLVESMVDALTLRAEPGTASERLGYISAGAVSFVVSGPETADGYEWYLLSGLGLPPASGCGPGSQGTEPYVCPIWLGWAAAADLDGTPWLAIHVRDCPEPSSVLETLTTARTPIELLHCYGDRELTFRAWWPTDEPDLPTICEAAVPWLGCSSIVLGWNEGYPEAITVAVDPADGITFPERGQWISVTAHMDDPEAMNCGSTTDATREDLDAILRCRATFVVSEVEPAPAP